MRIDSKLGEWQQKGLISAEQLQAISLYEQKNKNDYMLPGFVWLGIAIVVLGIIAIVAANWALIPDLVKLVVCFILLAVTAASCYRFRERLLLFDGLLFLLALLCLAAIGLIAQIFQTGGALYQALILWAIITLPLTLQAKKPFLARVWAWLTVFAIGWWLFQSNNSIYYVHFIFISVVLLCLLIGMVKIKQSLFAFHQQALLEIGCIGSVFSIFLIEQLVTNTNDFQLYSQYTDPRTGGIIPLISYFLMGLLTIVMVLLKLPKWQKILLLPVLILSLFEISCWWLNITLPLMLALIITLLNLFLLTVFFALNNQNGLYRLGLTAIALRMLWLYWFLLGNLITTAAIMVVTGIAIILLARQITKVKEPFLKRIGYLEESDHE